MIDELSYFNRHVWRGIDRTQDVQPSGKTVRTRWVLCNKGDQTNYDVRARLVACEINTFKDETGSFYASTPPLEAKRMLLSQFATERTRDGAALQLSFVDIRKAYFNAIPERSISVCLPPELGLSSKIVGHLRRCMYGTRDAASLWETTYRTQLEN